MADANAPKTGRLELARRIFTVSPHVSAVVLHLVILDPDGQLPIVFVKRQEKRSPQHEG
jgi:hypothetical protein